VGEIGRHLETHVAVARVSAVIHRPEDIRRVLNVLDRETLVHLLGIDPGTLAGDLVDGRRIVGAAVDRLLEDCRIRGDAAEPVFVHEPFELTAGDQAPPDEVQPDRLAVLMESGDRVRGHRRCAAVFAHDRILMFSFLEAAASRRRRRAQARSRTFVAAP
jgi:hypothetical protein